MGEKIFLIRFSRLISQAPRENHSFMLSSSTRNFPLQKYRSRYFNGIELFHLENHSPDFDDTVAFILQGLGDLVNGLGTIRLLKTRFPKGRWLVFMDPVWKDFGNILRKDGSVEIVELPLSGRYGQEDLLKSDDEIDSISRAFQIMKDRTLQERIFLGLSLQVGTLPDTYSRHESSLQTNCRLLMGFPVDHTILRPWAPFSRQDEITAKDFIRENGLEGKPFVVLAPHVDPEREWGMNRFQKLSKIIQSKMRMNVVVVGLPKLGYIESEDVVHGFGLSLTTVSALISMSNLFIGHDSGLTHVAASFNIPIIAIYAKWNPLLPFETRPHSPYASIIFELQPGLKKSAIPIELVVSVVASKISGVMREPPPCWACGGRMDFVVDGNKKTLLIMCSCGCMEIIESSSSCYSKETNRVVNKKNHSSSVIWKLPQNRLELEEFNTSICSFEELTFKLEDNFPGKAGFNLFGSDIESVGRIAWSFEGFILFMRRKEWFLLSSSGHQIKNNRWAGSLVFTKKLDLPRSMLRVPWNGKILKVYPETPYEIFFAWQSWAFRKSKLEDLIRRSVFWNDFQTAFYLSRTIFSVIMEPRIISRMIRLKWKMMFVHH